MINAILAIITVASALGQEPPTLVKPFASTESCLIEADKANKEHSEKLRTEGAAFVCLVVKYPTI
jgi:hypothetical protein